MRCVKSTPLAALVMAIAAVANLPTIRAAAPAPPAPPVNMQELIARLKSADPAQRQAAMQQMGFLNDLLRQPEILKSLVETTTDTDLKSFFQDRLDELKGQEEARIAANPPPISLSLKDASFREMVDALNDALQIADSSSKLVVNDANNAGGTFSLTAKEQPFWQIFTALQQQHPIDLLSSPTTGTTITNNRNGARPFAIDGSVIAFLDNLSYQRYVDLQSGDKPTRQSTFAIRLSLGIDPRVHISRLKMPTITKAVDDLGHEWTTPSTAVSSPTYAPSEIAFSSRSLTLTVPANPGKTLSFTCDSGVELALASKLVTIDDVAANVDKPISVAGRTIRINSFSVSPTGMASISVNSSIDPGFVRTGPDANPTTAALTIFDSTGKRLWSFTLSGGVGGSFQASNSTPPYKMEIRAATKTTQLPLHFEFRDVALP